MVLLHMAHKVPTNLDFFVMTDTNMANFSEIPLELQLKEAHCWIKDQLERGHKFIHFLSPSFLKWFPAIIDNQISVEWDTITSLFDRLPAFPITVIGTKILDG